MIFPGQKQIPDFSLISSFFRKVSTLREEEECRQTNRQNDQGQEEGKKKKKKRAAKNLVFRLSPRFPISQGHILFLSCIDEFRYPSKGQVLQLVTHKVGQFLIIGGGNFTCGIVKNFPTLGEIKFIQKATFTISQRMRLPFGDHRNDSRPFLIFGIFTRQSFVHRLLVQICA
jgi:hypothetical protein